MTIYTFSTYNDNDCEIYTKVFKTEDEAKNALNKAYKEVIDTYYNSNPSSAVMCEKDGLSAHIIGKINFEFKIERHEI